MDEAEKYKQRLEAIAEKRRLLEEQERAKREMEDERIRLQQLKRKSLRDQWLMEGPPLSPTSLEAPRSPLWGTQAKEIETRIEKLESTMQQLAEVEEKLKEVMEDGQTQETVVVEETPTEIIQNVVTNGKIAAGSGEESPHPDKVRLTNGAGVMEEDISHDASVNALPTINGLIEEEKSVQVVDIGNNVDEGDEEEDGTMVIRAECIMIVDEGDEMAEEPTKENGCAVENATLIPEETQKTGQSEENAAHCVEAELPQSVVMPNGVEENELEETAASHLQSHTEEGTVVASVPVYSETQPCITTTSPAEAENGSTNEEEKIEVVSKAKGNVTVEFQDVPLSEPQDKKARGEQEPLLSRVEAKEADPATPSSQTETPNTDQAETKMAKRKTCQCCSVM